MVSGRVYLAGGLDTSDVSISDVVAVDTAKGTAEVTGSMPNAFHDAAGAVIGGRLFVFAGGTGQGSDVVQSFDPSSGTGRIERGSLPKALSDLSSAEAVGVVYLVGGYDNVSPQGSIYATRDGRHFSVVGTLPVGLRYPAVVAQGSKVVIAGGQTASGLTDDVLLFDPATGRVRTVGHLPQPLAHGAAFVLGNTVYVAGGRNGAGMAVRGIESVDITTGKVRSAGKLPSPLADPGVVAEGQKVWLFGGWRGAPVSEVLVASLVPA
jgi:N-acetylneuraminic acid mutarotase